MHFHYTYIVKSDKEYNLRAEISPTYNTIQPNNTNNLKQVWVGGFARGPAGRKVMVPRKQLAMPRERCEQRPL